MYKTWPEACPSPHHPSSNSQRSALTFNSSQIQFLSSWGQLHAFKTQTLLLRLIYVPVCAWMSEYKDVYAHMQQAQTSASSLFSAVNGFSSFCRDNTFVFSLTQLHLWVVKVQSVPPNTVSVLVPRYELVIRNCTKQLIQTSQINS